MHGRGHSREAALPEVEVERRHRRDDQPPEEAGMPGGLERQPFLVVQEVYLRQTLYRPFYYHLRVILKVE